MLRKKKAQGGVPRPSSAPSTGPVRTLLPDIKAQGAPRDEDPDGEEDPEGARRPSSANVLDKMVRKNRLVYPLPLRTLKRVLVAPRMSVSSVQTPRDEDPDGEEDPEGARRPSSANVLDKMVRKNRLVYPLPLRTLKRVLVAPRMSVSSVQSL
ncbi:unnamed protein product [Gadus morhua 'NCC']